jgi:hypothetical protein
MLISLTSVAAGVSGSPNTQLIKVRLARSPVAAGVSSTYAWPYTLLVGGSPLQLIPYFDNPVTDPVVTGP